MDVHHHQSEPLQRVSLGSLGLQGVSEASRPLRASSHSDVLDAGPR